MNDYHTHIASSHALTLTHTQKHFHSMIHMNCISSSTAQTNHEDNSQYGKINCVDGRASSTCEVLYRIFKSGNWNITKSIAESLYTGIFTDTGSFTFSNTSPLTHRILAELLELGAEPSHMADMISQNKSVPGFRVWADALSRVKTFGPDDIFAVSWLSADDFRSAGADLTENEGLPSMLMTQCSRRISEVRSVQVSVHVKEVRSVQVNSRGCWVEEAMKEHQVLSLSSGH